MSTFLFTRTVQTSAPVIVKGKIQGEGIVHAGSNARKNMNKVSVLEGADGSPPF